jgi:hypothetical protein
MHSSHSTSRCYLITLADRVFNMDPQIGVSRQQSALVLFERRRTADLAAGQAIANAVLGEQLVNSFFALVVPDLFEPAMQE